MVLTPMQPNVEGVLSKKNILELEETLARLRALILNSSFTQKLPDKGEKLKIKAVKIEEELVARKVSSPDVRKNQTEVEKIDWNRFVASLKIEQNNPSHLHGTDSAVVDKRGLEREDRTSPVEEAARAVKDVKIDYSNNVDDLERTFKDELERTLKMLPTSRVSQQESKVTVTRRNRRRVKECPPLHVKMSEKTSPSSSLGSTKDVFGSSFGLVQSLTSEPSCQLSSEKCETLKETEVAQPKKIYAYEALSKTEIYNNDKLQTYLRLNTPRLPRPSPDNLNDDLEFSDELSEESDDGEHEDLDTDESDDGEYDEDRRESDEYDHGSNDSDTLSKLANTDDNSVEPPCP